MIERMHLAIVLAVEQQGSLTAAADSLHLTQSALSHSIRKLEQQLVSQRRLQVSMQPLLVMLLKLV